MIHELKISPEYITAILRGDKLFEVRKNDRNYKVGDYLHLKEWHKDKYTGSHCMCRVTYVLNDPIYCKDGFVVMGIKPFK